MLLVAVSMLTLQATTNIKNWIESTFQPLHCFVRLYDRGEKLRFKVLDLDYDTAFESPELKVRDLTTDSRLLEVIEAARSRIHARRSRLNLASWSV